MKCSGKNCGNEATWMAVGWAAQFGVPMESLHCDSCKREIEAEGEYNDPIMSYNRFKIEWKPLAPQAGSSFRVESMHKAYDARATSALESALAAFEEAPDIDAESDVYIQQLEVFQAILSDILLEVKRERGLPPKLFDDDAIGDAPLDGNGGEDE